MTQNDDNAREPAVQLVDLDRVQALVDSIRSFHNSEKRLLQDAVAELRQRRRADLATDPRDVDLDRLTQIANDTYPPAVHTLRDAIAEIRRARAAKQVDAFAAAAERDTDLVTVRETSDGPYTADLDVKDVPGYRIITEPDPRIALHPDIEREIRRANAQAAQRAARLRVESVVDAEPPAAPVSIAYMRAAADELDRAGRPADADLMRRGAAELTEHRNRGFSPRLVMDQSEAIRSFTGLDKPANFEDLVYDRLVRAVGCAVGLQGRTGGDFHGKLRAIDRMSITLQQNWHHNDGGDTVTMRLDHVGAITSVTAEDGAPGGFSRPKEERHD